MNGFIYGILVSFALDAVALYFMVRNPSIRARLRYLVRGFLGIDQIQAQIGQIHYSVHRIEDAVCAPEQVVEDEDDEEAEE
jgi:hypothetical protein